MFGFSSEVQAEDIVIKAVSEYDLEQLAHLIMAEGGAENLDYAVPYGIGSVVLNRVNHKYYPDNIYDVIHQKGQYAVSGYYMDLEPTDRCYKIAYDLLSNGTVYPDGVIYQAGFTQGTKVYKYIDGVYFCYE